MGLDKFGRVDSFSPYLEMSIDKFGRHRVSTSTTTSRPGFSLASDGNYDFENKSIHNLGDPKHPKDAVTSKYLETIALTTGLNTHYDAKQKYIRNVLPPILPNDVATRQFVEKVSLKKTFDGHYDVENKRIINMRLPLLPTDAVSKEYIDNMKESYLMKNEDGEFNAVGARLSNLGTPSNPNDAVTKHYLENFALTKVPGTKVSWDYLDYDARNKRITRLADPILNKDAVSLDYVSRRCLSKRDISSTQSYWDADKIQLTNLKDPEDLSDAVSINYLVRLFSEVVYWMYARLAPRSDNIHKTEKNQWVHENVVNPFFLNEASKVRSLK